MGRRHARCNGEREVGSVRETHAWGPKWRLATTTAITDRRGKKTYNRPHRHTGLRMS